MLLELEYPPILPPAATAEGGEFVAAVAEEAGILLLLLLVETKAKGLALVFKPSLETRLLLLLLTRLPKVPVAKALALLFNCCC